MSEKDIISQNQNNKKVPYKKYYNKNNKELNNELNKIKQNYKKNKNKDKKYNKEEISNDTKEDIKLSETNNIDEDGFTKIERKKNIKFKKY